MECSCHSRHTTTSALEQSFILINPNTHAQYRWRRQRRIVHEGFNKSAASRFHSAEAEEATRLAVALLRDPANIHNHYRNYVSSVMLSVTYDRPLHGGPDDKVLRAGIDEFIKQNIAFTGIEQLAQIMPWLAHVPEWSAKWKRDVRLVYEETTRFFMGMVDDVEERMVSVALPLFTRSSRSLILMISTRNKVLLARAW